MANSGVLFDPSIWNPTASSVRNVDLELVYYGQEQCMANKEYGPGTKNHYKVHYVHSGKGKIVIREKVYHVHQGQCFVFYPDEVVYYIADSEDPWSYSWIAFDGANAEFYLNRANVNRDNIIIEECNQEVLTNLFNELLKVDMADETKDMKFISLLYMILSTIMVRNEDKAALLKMKHPSTYVKTAIKYVQEHYAEPLTVVGIANYLNLERKYFSRVFKDAVRMSPSSYITNYRIMKACEMMDETDMSIGEIALSVGYVNQFSFSRAFKHVKNIAPTDYKNEKDHKGA